MKRYLLLLLGALCGIVSAEERSTYWSRSTWDDPERGFLWYATPRQPVAPPETLRPMTEMSNKELGEAIERLLNIAVEQQTPETVRSYLLAQQYAMNRASRFSDVFRRTVWASPELDYSLRGRPANALAVAAYDAQRVQARNGTSAALAATHGLFFFFKGDCSYCHQLAPVLNMYQRAYGVEVFPVSLDGGTLPEFPNARRDNGSARKLQVNAVPALFLADKRSGAIQPIGYGLMSLEDIVTRVHTLTRTQPGEEY
ncbi:conjugal transfer protein TraF [Pseudoduganella umbonata]|uniref:Conjugal transfer pilus assembly protein TraF n=1 Tax=Pseudoduganella umbonata TaxID=864828 RepID=A0A4P8HHT5_9BURK|nr:conjugal transfer protein TraF [Pseudoduganella umbonata]MBB3221717.1 conjugal transfer pilus assembly protein TraF [Pseudoduganella umbonata]QCP09063.1 conjugal transfer protein TraF [Pseudoduganella umbonata]